MLYMGKREVSETSKLFSSIRKKLDELELKINSQENTEKRYRLPPRQIRLYDDMLDGLSWIFEDSVEELQKSHLYPNSRGAIFTGIGSGNQAFISQYCREHSNIEDIDDVVENASLFFACEDTDSEPIIKFDHEAIDEILRIISKGTKLYMNRKKQKK